MIVTNVIHNECTPNEFATLDFVSDFSSIYT